MKEWTKYTAQEFCVNVTDGTHDSPKPTEVGHYLITSKHLQNNSIDFSSAYKISEEDYLKVIKRSAVVQHDILFSMIGTIGNTVRVKDSTVDYAVKNMAIFKMGGDEIKSKWLYYWLKSFSAKEYISSRLAGSTQSYLTLDTLRNFPVFAPAENKMKLITSILSSIDDKIEVNRQINDNLEQQAQAAFNNIIANTTSDKTVQLSEIAWLNPKRSISKGKVARSIEMAHLPTTGSFPSGWEMKEYNGGMKFQNGDTLMARITPCLENGKVAFVNFLEDDEIAFGSTEYITMTPKRQFAPEVLYFLVRNAEFIDFAVKNMNGSSGRQRVSADTIGTFELPDITLEELHMLETIAREALTKIKYNSLENMRLAEMRDTLLPKLMSGELKTNEIDC